MGERRYCPPRDGRGCPNHRFHVSLFNWGVCMTLGTGMARGCDGVSQGVVRVGLQCCRFKARLRYSCQRGGSRGWSSQRTKRFTAASGIPPLESRGEHGQQRGAPVQQIHVQFRGGK